MEEDIWFPISCEVTHSFGKKVGIGRVYDSLGTFRSHTVYWHKLDGTCSAIVPEKIGLAWCICHGYTAKKGSEHRDKRYTF
jgi:hypothetical protein